MDYILQECTNFQEDTYLHITQKEFKECQDKQIQDKFQVVNGTYQYFVEYTGIYNITAVGGSLISNQGDIIYKGNIIKDQFLLHKNDLLEINLGRIMKNNKDWLLKNDINSNLGSDTIIYNLSQQQLMLVGKGGLYNTQQYQNSQIQKQLQSQQQILLQELQNSNYKEFDYQNQGYVRIENKYEEKFVKINKNETKIIDIEQESSILYLEKKQDEELNIQYIEIKENNNNQNNVYWWVQDDNTIKIKWNKDYQKKFIYNGYILTQNSQQQQFLYKFKIRFISYQQNRLLHENLTGGQIFEFCYDNGYKKVYNDQLINSIDNYENTCDPWILFISFSITFFTSIFCCLTQIRKQEELEKENNDLKKENNDFQKKNEQKNKEFNDLKRENERKKKENKDLKKENNDFQKKNEQKNKEFNDLKRENERKEIENNDLKKENNDFQKKNEQKNKEFNDLKRENERKEKENNDLKKENNDFQKKNEQKNEEFNDLKRENERKEKENKDLKNEKQIFQDEIEIYQIQMYEQQSVIDNLIQSRFNSNNNVQQQQQQLQQQQEKQIKPIPVNMRCSISLGIFADPVVNFANNVYDKDSILKIYENQEKSRNWQGFYKDPLTNQQSQDKTLRESRQLKDIITEYLLKEYTEDDLLYDYRQNRGELMEYYEQWLQNVKNKQDPDVRKIKQMYNNARNKINS